MKIGERFADRSNTTVSVSAPRSKDLTCPDGQKKKKITPTNKPKAVPIRNGPSNDVSAPLFFQSFSRASGSPPLASRGSPAPHPTPPHPPGAVACAPSNEPLSRVWPLSRARRLIGPCQTSPLPYSSGREINKTST